MNNLAKIASMPGSGGGTMSAMPAEKPAEPHTTDYDEALKLATKLMNDAFADALEAYKAAMREMAQTIAQEAVKQALSELPEDELLKSQEFSVIEAATGGVVKGAPFFEKEAAEAFQPCAVTFRFSEYVQENIGREVARLLSSGGTTPDSTTCEDV
jgi:hypothetical protein